MTKKLKFCYIAYEFFEDIFKHQPMLTGCYQWQRIFNGECRNWRDIKDKAELEKYDAVMVNLDPVDCRLAREVRWMLGDSSSTQLIVNQDHAPELWQHSYQTLVDFKSAMLDADKVFATAPYAQELMSQLLDNRKKIWLNPHPCETHSISKIKSTYESDHLLVFWHRYDANAAVPYIITKDIYKTITLAGYSLSEYDKERGSNAAIIKTSFKSRIPALPFFDFLKVLKEAKAGFEPFTSYSYGRLTCDTAALGLPIVGSNRLYSMQVNYPLTCFDPFDLKSNRAALSKILTNDAFREEVSDIARYNVRYFGHDMCRDRFMEMYEGV